ncbi:hypothetical protein HX038_08200 [Myroides odoratimimus]|uniref:hypothetical protein n=1 Tax=Myroides odoratimimus TaxID=76832 RepID=UPI002578DF47|nr:hypothetical protein [Myroides odoratimimus]MDM1410736.1 hypothetical protein [Myroides odoratimimus]MDM1519364.1 hypothetical protein [Myroides odoratimimus]MEC4007682.1 hypothetical protein [Myroides odoratimimus]
MCDCIEFVKNNFSGFATICAALIAGIIAYIYQKGNLNLTHEKMEKELFTEFNKRYDELNDSLALLTLTINISELKTIGTNIGSKSLYNVLIDYFNLCAEQYYWYKKGRISNEIWNAWHSGMMYYYNTFPVVKELWEEETKEEGFKSYYLKDKLGFFK